MISAEQYLDAIRSADLDGMLRLFADGAEVHSPLYGVVPAADFFPKLFAETDRMLPTLRRVFRDGDDAIAFWFDAAWTLASGETATVTLVDVAELNADGLIERLYIVYDTATLGATFTAKAAGTAGTA